MTTKKDDDFVYYSKTPWRLGSGSTKDCIYEDGEQSYGNLIADCAGQDANAAYIVRAVNSHEELLQVAKDALSLALLASYPNEQKDSQIIKRIKEAIAKAEGGK